jgi:hypothetical protein
LIVGKKITGNALIDADVETTFLAISGERWPEANAAALKDDSRVVSREQLPDGGVKLVHSRALPAGVPGFLKPFLPKDGRVLQTDTWEPARVDGSRHGTWHIAFPGAPGHVGGATWLAPTGSSTTWHVDGEAKVRIPMIGGKAESFLAPLVEKVILKQAPVLQALVKEQP